MKSIIPYTKNISFGSKIAEITSMSLEHELKIEPGEMSGNFIVSGEYKSHEVSVNREPFLHKLPFSIELTDNIDLDSLKFEITDFSYDVLNDDTVEIDIEFSLEAEEKEIEEIIDDEEEPEKRIIEEAAIVNDLTELIDNREEDLEEGIVEESLIEDERFVEIQKEQEEMQKEKEEILEAKEQLAAEMKKMEAIQEQIEIEKAKLLEQKDEMEQVQMENDRMEEEIEMEEDNQREKMVELNVKEEDMKESEEVILKSVNPADDSYTTYHIHIVKEGESIETICSMYQSNMNLLAEYNNMKELNIGDKVIIPKEDE